MSGTKLTGLLSGRTFYIVEVDIEYGRTHAKMKERVRFNNEVTEAKFDDVDRYAAKVHRDILYIMDFDNKHDREKYIFIKTTEEYIKFRCYRGSRHETYRFYFSKAKAKAFVAANPYNLVTPDPIPNAYIGDLIGTWVKKCDDGARNEYYTEELIFRSDMTVSEKKLVYSISNCTGDLIREENKKMTYEVGELVQAADGKDAFEIDLIEADGDTYFKMLRFISRGLIFSKTAERNSQLSGEIAETRKNYFDASPDIWIKN